MTFERLPLLFTILFPLPIITICLITIDYAFLEYIFFYMYRRPQPVNATNKLRCCIKLEPLCFVDTCTLVFYLITYVKINLLI